MLCAKLPHTIYPLSLGECMRNVICFLMLLMLSPTTYANNRDLYQDQETNLIEMNDVSAVVIDGVILMSAIELKLNMQNKILVKYFAEQRLLVQELQESKAFLMNELKSARLGFVQDLEKIELIKSNIKAIEGNISLIQEKVQSLAVTADKGDMKTALKSVANESVQGAKSIKILSRVTSSLSVLAAADILFRTGMIVFDYDTDPSAIPGAAIYKTIEYIVE